MKCLGPATQLRCFLSVRRAQTSLVVSSAVFEVSSWRVASATSVASTDDGYESHRQATQDEFDAYTADVRGMSSMIGPRPPISSEGQQPDIQQRISPVKHRYSRVNSLARALRLKPPQVAAMLRDYPALANYNHAQLADKVVEMAQLLQVSPNDLSQALVAKPKILGISLAEFESRVRELSRLFGSRHVLSQLVLEEPKLLSWNVHHLKQRLTNMSACLDLQHDQLIMMIRKYPQLLPASSNLVKCLQLVQQLVQMADAASSKGFGLLQLPQQQQQIGQQQQQWVEQQKLMRQMTFLGQQIQQQTQQQQQQQRPEVQQLQQRLYQLQQRLQHIQQQQQNQVSWSAAQRLALQHPLLLLLPPEHILAQLATMQAQSGLSVVEVAAVVVANPQLLTMNRDFTNTNTTQQQQQQQQQLAIE